MKRIWFTQQKPYDYTPLRWGLGYTSPTLFEQDRFSPKIYTTRTHPLDGEYYVVEGSRFKAKPVEPKIEFRVDTYCQLDLRNALVIVTADSEAWCTPLTLERDGCSFAELDLGIKGATFEQLRDELLRLNPKATPDTPFFVNRLEPLTVIDFNEFGGKKYE